MKCAKQLSFTMTTSTNLVYAGWIFEKNETKSSWPARLLVNFDGAVWHLTKLGEVIFEILFGCVPAQATNKHFPECKR